MSNDNPAPSLKERGLVITRVFDAPIELVWKAWAGALDQLANYLTKNSKEVL